MIFLADAKKREIYINATGVAGISSSAAMDKAELAALQQVPLRCPKFAGLSFNLGHQIHDHCEQCCDAECDGGSRHSGQGGRIGGEDADGDCNDHAAIPSGRETLSFVNTAI